MYKNVVEIFLEFFKRIKTNFEKSIQIKNNDWPIVNGQRRQTQITSIFVVFLQEISSFHSQDIVKTKPLRTSENWLLK